MKRNGLAISNSSKNIYEHVLCMSMCKPMTDPISDEKEIWSYAESLRFGAEDIQTPIDGFLLSW